MILNFKILPNLRKKVMESAYFHIVTNDIHKNIVESSNGRAIVLGVLIERSDSIKKYDFEKEKNFIWIASYSPDEPLDIVFDVAKNLPDVNIYITGNIKKAPKYFTENCMNYKNIILTGFLPVEKYISYIKGSTAAIALTTLDNTMQRGAYTALSYNIPLITSDWELLRNNFYKGTIHIDNTAVALEGAIRKICDDMDYYKKEISELRNIHDQAFEQNIMEIRNRLNNDL